MRTQKTNTRLLIYGIALLLVFSTGYLALSVVSTGNARPVTPIRLVSGVWEPFVSPDLPDNGPVARIVTETFQRINYEPEITFASWDSVLDQTQRVEVQGAFPFIATDDREAQYYLSDPILAFDYVLFYYAPNISNPTALVTPQDFIDGGYTFGKVEGYEVWSALADANFTFTEYPTREDAFEALVRGEINFLPESLLVGQTVARSVALSVDSVLIRHLDVPDNNLLSATEELHLLLPRSDGARRLLDAFNTELSAMRHTTVYIEALAEIQDADNTAETVELQPTDGNGLIQLTDNEGQTYLAPLGTRALVLDWSPIFQIPMTFAEINSTIDMNEQMVTVKLLNGPLQGRVMFVNAQAVRLETP